MFPVLQETVKKSRGCKKAHNDECGALKRDLRADCNECKHTLFLSNIIYCGMEKENVTKDLLESCLNFEQVALEYKFSRDRKKRR